MVFRKRTDEPRARQDSEYAPVPPEEQYDELPPSFFYSRTIGLLNNLLVWGAILLNAYILYFVITTPVEGLPNVEGYAYHNKFLGMIQCMPVQNIIYLSLLLFDKRAGHIFFGIFVLLPIIFLLMFGYALSHVYWIAFLVTAVILSRMFTYWNAFD